MKWFRMYAEILDDPKVQTLRPELFKFWVNLLALACREGRGGELPEIPEIAYKLRMRIDRVKQFMNDLQALNLINTCCTGHLKPHNWDVRQPLSDCSKERVRLYRERSCKHKQTPDVTLQSTLQSQHSNGAVTPLELELEEKNSPPQSACAPAHETVVGANPPTLPSTPRRAPEDQAEVDAACALLGSTLGSEHLAMQVGQQSDIPGMVEIEGWKFHEAAKRLLDPAKARGLRGNWKYYLGIVRGLRDDERPNSARAAPSPSANGQAAPRRTLEETTEDYGRMMREAKAAERRARGEPEMTPEYKTQLAQYNEIMRRFHERRL